MSQMLIQRETLVGIADAVRAKSGASGSIPVPNLAAKIMEIEIGGGDGGGGGELVEEYDGKDVKIE